MATQSRRIGGVNVVADHGAEPEALFPNFRFLQIKIKLLVTFRMIVKGPGNIRHRFAAILGWLDVEPIGPRATGTIGGTFQLRESRIR